MRSGDRSPVLARPSGRVASPSSYVASQSSGGADTYISWAITWSIELRVWVAVCVTSLCAFAIDALGLVTDSSVLVCVAASSLAIYNLDGFLDALHGQKNRSPIRAYVHAGISGSAVVVALASSCFLSWPARGLVWSGLLLCGCYALQLPRLLDRRRKSPTAAARAGLPLETRRPAIKTIPGMKAPFVGSAVAIAVVWLPTLAGPSTPEMIPTIVCGLSLVCFCTANTLLFDIADVEEDAQREVPTLPLLLGVARTRRWAAMLCLSGTAIMAPYGNFFAAGSVWGIFALGGALLLATAFVGTRTPRDRVALGIDGALIWPWVVQSLAP